MPVIKNKDKYDTIKTSIENKDGISVKKLVKDILKKPLFKGYREDAIEDTIDDIRKTMNESYKLPTFNVFIDERKIDEKGGTEPDNKDAERIDDLVKKGGGDADSDKSLALASQMAKSIKDGEKAYRRGAAAKEIGYKKIANIFFDKAGELGVTEGKDVGGLELDTDIETLIQKVKKRL